MADKDPNLLILVDGSSYLYRAFHALPALTNSSGDPTGAILGVTNMLTRLFNDHETSHMAVVFDAKGPTFRHDIYDQYKANRPPMPEELRDQIEPIHQIAQLLGFPLLQVAGVEADDVIGTLAKRASKRGMRVVVSTGDKDLTQLVDDQVTLVDTMKNSKMDAAAVQEKFGVRPDQIVDYLGLVGDASDNIPGVPKVGPKTAAKWLNAYDNLDKLIENSDQIKGKVGESLRDHIPQLVMSRELARIRQDIDLEIKPQDLKLNPRDTSGLRELYTRLEFNTLIKQLPEKETELSDSGGDDNVYEIVLTKKSFKKWLKRLQDSKCFAFDTETTSLNYMVAEIVGVSFCVAQAHAAYVPVAHSYAGAPQQLDRDYVLGKLRPLLEDPEKPKTGHHLKYDAHVLRNHGVELRGIEFDTMLESYVLNSTATRHDMDSVSRRYLGIDPIHYEDVAGKGAKQITFDQVHLDTAGPYAAEDADLTLRLHHVLWPQLEKLKRLSEVYTTIEKPLVPVLLEMEHTGVCLDIAMLRDLSVEFAGVMKKLEEAAHAAAGGPFNLGSPKQLQEILFEKQGLPVIRKTPKGQPSTAEDVLQELAHDYPLPQLILDYRSLSKLKSTYSDKLPELADPETGRVHTSYHQAVAATGRLSSADPNLQNIPIRTAQGRRIRQAFIASPGYTLLAADYSQIELRIMAHLSKDDGLCQAFADDRDIHQATAAEVFTTPLEDVTADQRRSAKAINFGLIYGMSAFGLAKQLNISRHAAQDYVNLYFERYPGVRDYMDRTRIQARDEGYVETVFGRRLYLPDINARNVQRRQYAERSAINAPMQGTAADIIKRAMISVYDWLQSESVNARLIMQVHDELVLEVDESIVQDVMTSVKDLMCAAATLNVPLKVDADTGANWDEAH
ncbi:MAG: DNA polymerase I [Gammaproteobacteria bacterium]|nr:DNA polymerase I [Gammaproteobacteria bacterium]